MKDLQSQINIFTENFDQAVEYDGLTAVSHRYRSWEYCRMAFLKYKDGLPKNGIQEAVAVDALALHLAFYLASWGMYRGSSFLLRYDYKIHVPAVRWLLDVRYHELFDGYLYQTNPQKYLELLFGETGIIEKLEGYFKACRRVIKGGDNEEVSATLITKILMGVYGCIPAYDRYFIDGLGASNIQKKFSVRGVKALLAAIQEYSQEINLTVKVLNKKFANVYTPMKVVDMYYWGKGKALDGEDVE